MSCQVSPFFVLIVFLYLYKLKLFKMPLNVIQGATKLFKIVKRGDTGYHQDYKKVNKLADLYRRLITGEEAEKLLIQFTPREGKDLFAQRIRLTQLLTPSICEKIMQPFYKVSRIDNIKKSITFESENNGDDKDKVKAIKEAMGRYYGDEGLDDFMETVFVDLVFTDPNSFIITEFDEFDINAGEKASPFPFLVSSKEAINYKYVNNVLEYLLVEKKITFVKGKEKKKEAVEGSKYRFYLENDVIVLLEVDPELGGTKVEDLTEDTLFEVKRIKIGERVFVLSVNNHEGGEVPAIRVGYKRDISTKGRTVLSPLQPAIPRMMKSVKAVSELDLTTTLHVFPQKMQYVEACSGSDGNPCRSGKNIKNENCNLCGGTGLAIHKSSADAITFPMPKDPADMIDLEKLLVYKNPPVDLIKWQDEYVEKLEKKSLTDVFVSESLNQITKTQTATEKELDMESIYDTLFPFAKRFSAVYKKQGRLISTFIDQDNAIIIHKFPKDFKLKTEKALLEDLKSAKDADAPAFLKTEIENDIASKVYGDNPLKMREYVVKQQHIPFSGKTVEEITMSINLGLTTKFDKILYANFDSIMSEIDQEQIKAGSDFYLLSYEARVDLIKAKVDEYNKRIEAERGSSSMFNSQEDLEQERIDAENRRTEEEGK